MALHLRDNGVGVGALQDRGTAGQRRPIMEHGALARSPQVRGRSLRGQAFACTCNTHAARSYYHSAEPQSSDMCRLCSTLCMALVVSGVGKRQMNKLEQVVRPCAAFTASLGFPCADW